MTLEGWLLFFLCPVDDGTAVIDCNHNHPQPTQRKIDVERISSELSVKPKPPLELKPVAKVGNFVRVVGKVRAVHDSRQIIVDQIGLSMSIALLTPTDRASLGRHMQFSKRRTPTYENYSPVASDVLFFKRAFCHSTMHISISFYNTNQESSHGHANALNYPFQSSFVHII